MGVYIQGCRKILDKRHIRQLRFTCPSEQRRRGAGFWDFRGKVVNSQVDGKEPTGGNQIFTGPPRKKNGTQREV